MEHYQLKTDEVVLYKGNEVYYRGENKEIELILTNYAIVAIKKVKKLFKAPVVNVSIYPVGEIKRYKNLPQIKQEGGDVEVYLVDKEVAFRFVSKNNAGKFVSACLELLVEKSAFERAATKVKDTIAVVDDTLGIDTVGTITAGVQSGANGFLTGNTVKKGGVLRGLVGALQGAVSAQVKKDEPKMVASGDGFAEIEKWKKLLDSGVITQEEFDKKKKEILGL